MRKLSGENLSAPWSIDERFSSPPAMPGPRQSWWLLFVNHCWSPLAHAVGPFKPDSPTVMMSVDCATHAAGLFFCHVCSRPASFFCAGIVALVPDALAQELAGRQSLLSYRTAFGGPPARFVAGPGLHPVHPKQDFS